MEFSGDTGREVCGYRLGRTLGKGMSGKVKLGARLTDGYLVALKFIDKSTLMPRQHEMLVREVTAMQRLSHPNILQLYQVEDNVVYPRKNAHLKGAKVCVMLVLELSNGGELFDYLMHTGPFDDVLARTYFRQLLASLEVCHGKGVAHRDLKPENLLLDGSFSLKLADFGLASVSPAEQPAPLACATECGTRSYMSPEVMSKQPYDATKADLWSAGVVLFIMVAGNPPFQVAGGTDWWYRACAANRHDRFWMAHLRTCPHFPPACQEFLNLIFVVDPSKRAGVDDLWEHPWLQGPTYSAEELVAAMSTRATQANAMKMQELHAAQAAKAAAAAGHMGGATEEATFDAFGAQAAYRSAPTSESESPSSRGTLAPPPAGILSYFYIDAAGLAPSGDAGCSDDGAAAARAVAEALTAMGATSKVAGQPSTPGSRQQPLQVIKASFPHSTQAPNLAAPEAAAAATAPPPAAAAGSGFDEDEALPPLPPTLGAGAAPTNPHRAGGAVELVVSLWPGFTASEAESSSTDAAPPPAAAAPAVFRVDVERVAGDPIEFNAQVQDLSKKLEPLLRVEAQADTGAATTTPQLAAVDQVTKKVAEVQVAGEAEVLAENAEEDVF